MTYEAWRISYQSSEQAARAAYAEMLEAKAAQEWQPIETAPKDRYIWLGNESNMRVGYWPNWKDDPAKVTGRGWADLGMSGHGHGPIGLQFAPTNWMDVPKHCPTERPHNGELSQARPA